MSAPQKKTKKAFINKLKITDDRFTDANIDPRFKTLPQKLTKVTIDPRFAKILKEKSKFDHVEDLYQLETPANPESSSNNSSENEEDISVNSETSQEQDILPEEPVQMAESISSKLALQNYDWGQLKAKDLFILFDSLCQSSTKDPSVPTIKSVEVYLSDFGTQRLEQEATSGPVELIDSRSTNDYINESCISQNRLREYEKNRLKYYFAVIYFQNEKTAEQIYNDFDGVEFEFTGFQLDLRFVPTDLKIPKKPVELCCQVSEKDRSETKVFATQSIAHTNVRLTWDEPVLRNTAFMFEKEEIQKDKLKDFVNLDNSEDEINEDARNSTLLNFLDENQESGFGDFKKKGKSKAKVTFKVGFGENLPEKNNTPFLQKKRDYNPFKNLEKEKKIHEAVVQDGEEEDDFLVIPKIHKSKKEVIRNGIQKKLDKKIKNEKDNEELLLLVDADNNLTTQKKGENFVADYEDARFKRVLEDPEFQLDRTHPSFNIEKNKGYLQAKNSKRVKQD